MLYREVPDMMYLGQPVYYVPVPVTPDDLPPEESPPSPGPQPAPAPEPTPVPREIEAVPPVIANDLPKPPRPPLIHF